MSGARPDTTARQEGPVDPGLFDHGRLTPGPPRRCANCGEPHPEPVFDGSNTNFLCHRCGTCWHVGMGFLWPVHPLACPGCPRLDRCRSVPTWLAESMTTVHHLADGTRMMVRPLLGSDGALAGARLDHQAGIDNRDQFAWAVFALDEPDQPGVGLARFIRLPDHPATAEVAVTILAGYRRRGIGTLVVAKLVEAARARGIDTFVAHVPADDTAWLDHLWSIGARTVFHEPGITRVELPLPTP